MTRKEYKSGGKTLGKTMIEFSDNAPPWDTNNTQQATSLGLAKGVVQALANESAEDAVSKRVLRLYPNATHLFRYRAFEIGVKDAGLELFHFEGARYFRFCGMAYTHPES